MTPNLFNYKMKILFWHRKNKINSRNEAPIYCRITINGNRGNDFSTNVFCPISYFDSKKQIIIDNEIENIKLQSIKHKLNLLYIELTNKNENVHANLLKQYFQGKKSIQFTIGDLMNDYLEHRLQIVKNGEITEATLQKCRITLKNFNNFLTENSIKNTPINGLNSKLGMDFYYWLQKSLNTGLAYAAKSMQVIKAMLNYAILNEYIKYNPFQALRFKRGQRKKIEYLTPEEIKKIALFNFKSERLQQVSDLFLLQCYTGFSYSDLGNFNSKKHIEIDIKGREWIVKPRTKNGYDAVLPYFPEAKFIIEKYTSVDQFGLKMFLPQISNQKYNAYLKEIGEILGIETKLTTHIGRKTFGTIALNNGYSIESVSRMLGHSNIKTTQTHYAVILKERIFEEFEQN
jgi:integrase/recombinase XerD